MQLFVGLDRMIGMGTYLELMLDLLLPRACAHCREDLGRADHFRVRSTLTPAASLKASEGRSRFFRKGISSAHSA